jgi:hypothetical protein
MIYYVVEGKCQRCGLKTNRLRLSRFLAAEHFSRLCTKRYDRSAIDAFSTGYAQALETLVEREANVSLFLDGRGIRGISELVIPDKIMRRAQHDLRLRALPKPADFFHLIGGTSTGGFVGLPLCEPITL